MFTSESPHWMLQYPYDPCMVYLLYLHTIHGWYGICFIYLISFHPLIVCHWSFGSTVEEICPPISSTMKHLLSSPAETTPMSGNEPWNKWRFEDYNYNYLWFSHFRFSQGYSYIWLVVSTPFEKYESKWESSPSFGFREGISILDFLTFMNSVELPGCKPKHHCCERRLWGHRRYWHPTRQQALH